MCVASREISRFLHSFRVALLFISLFTFPRRLVSRFVKRSVAIATSIPVHAVKYRGSIKMSDTLYDPRLTAIIVAINDLQRKSWRISGRQRGLGMATRCLESPRVARESLKRLEERWCNRYLSQARPPALSFQIGKPGRACARQLRVAKKTLGNNLNI